ncbi:MAG: hypothetical protein M1830_002005, partial [Pleopsidium flavum]
MAFHGPFTSAPPHFQGFGVPPSLSHPYSYIVTPNGSTPTHSQHAPFNHAVVGLHNRIGVLETQLTHVQGEKASMHAAIQYLLETLATTTGARSSSLDRSASDLSILKMRLALTRKENRRLKVKLRKIIISKASSGFKFRHSAAKGGVIIDRHGNTVGSDNLICTDSPDSDLLGGTIPFSVIEQYPAASFSSINPSYGESPPELGASDDDESSSESESESLSLSSTKYNWSGRSHRQRGIKNSASGLIPDLHLNNSNITENTCSSQSLPYIQYFFPSATNVKVGNAQDVEEKLKVFTASQGTTPAEELRAFAYQDYATSLSMQSHSKIGGEPVARDFHAGQLNIQTNLSAIKDGPVLVKIGPHVPGEPQDRSETLITPSDFTGQIKSYTLTGSSADDPKVTTYKDVFGDVDEIFATRTERENAITINRRVAGPKDLAFPDLFRYGIRYNPHPTEQNVYRTVTIEGLPATITLEALLKKVRGGDVVSSKLCDTFSITGFHTALITFLRESAASDYEDFAALHPICFGGQVAKVSMLSTPTWPMTIPLKTAIFDHHHTRCLEVRNFPRQTNSLALRRDLRICSSMECDMIETLTMRHDGILEIRFSSVGAAGQAFGILTSYRAYRQCNVAFSPDPCALPLKTMLEQRHPKPSDGYHGENAAIDDEVSADQFADDEGIGEDEDYLEEDQLDVLEAPDGNSADLEHGKSVLGLSEAAYL